LYNTLFSPLVLAASLETLGETARGATADHIRRVLRSSSQKEAPSAASYPQALRSAVDSNLTAFTLRAASALFTKQVAALDQNFLKRARSGGVGRIGLNHVALGSGGKKPDSATFHTWAQGATGTDNVAQLSKEPQAQSGALVLANALRIKGLWEKGFGESSEDLRTFLGVKYTRVPLMHRSGIYRHYEDVANMVQVLELGLRGGEASMLILLPFLVEKLERLEKLITLEQLQSWHSKLTDTSLALSLPRVTLRSSLNLQAALTTLGLVDVWTQGKADFSGLGGAKGQMHLGGVLHWASLEFSPDSGHKKEAKDGEEATVEEEEEEDVDVSPKMFYADHSFVVMVMDKASGALVLMGAMDVAEGRSLHDEL
ncbi:serine (or cysteine) peptidase inhibitor, clade H, member 2, partial [Engraulis encrasicolus]|uniref:serine (or cysteine) peptidase inhibitor, clade H, member 2 n=1 Tax=Engraulis encrasicolus TaxID=184585 RepID=UPI002FD0B5D7